MIIPFKGSHSFVQLHKSMVVVRLKVLSRHCGVDTQHISIRHKEQSIEIYSSTLDCKYIDRIVSVSNTISNYNESWYVRVPVIVTEC